MSYLLRSISEYGDVSYFDDFTKELIEFKTLEDAEKKAEELLDMEYEDFGSAITKYSIVELKEKSVKDISSFKICDDGKECILSCTSDFASQLEDSLKEAKKQYDCKITKDKTYENGSRVIQFTYSKKKEKEEDCDVILKVKDNRFEAIYDTKDRMEMSALAYALKDKYKDELSYFCDERVNNAGCLTFKLTNNKEEFKKDFLKCAEIFFKVKVVNM